MRRRFLRRTHVSYFRGSYRWYRRHLYADDTRKTVRACILGEVALDMHLMVLGQMKVLRSRVRT
jgi:hypothetical protein